MPRNVTHKGPAKGVVRPIWKGNISFGLIVIPVRLYSAEHKSEELKFHLVDSKNRSRIRNQRVNEVTGEEVPWDRIVKGYVYDDEGNYVLLDDEDLKKADMRGSETVQVEEFVPTEAINAMYFEKPYFLVPEKKAEHAYALLRDTLKKTGLTGIARVVIRTREYIAALMPQGRAMVLNLMRYTYELRTEDDFRDLPSDRAEDIRLSSKEIEMAEMFVNSMKGTFDPEKYRDEYRERLYSFIQKKARSGGVVRVEEAPAEEGVIATESVDLMELLRKSIEQKESREDKQPGGRQRRHQPSA